MFDIQNDYKYLLLYLRDKGRTTSPRGMPTRECLDMVLEIDPYRPIANGINRGLSTKLISLEALQLIGGASYPDLTVKAAPNMAQFMDGGAFHGSYGQRIRNQLPAVVDRLRTDYDTRQAVMTIWDPAWDLYGDVRPRDVPCTAMLQFLVRDDKLILHTTMRSNDVWWGTPHDLGQFTQLQLAVANVLGMEAGVYLHHAVSMHLYERDIEKIDKLTAPTSPPITLCGIGYDKIPVLELQQRARDLIEDQHVLDVENLAESWHRTQQMKIRTESA